MDTAIYNILTSTTAITDLVGDRVFPSRRDQSAEFPLLVYKKITSPTTYNHDGKRFNDIYLDVFIYSSTYSELTQLVEALNDLSGTSGAFGDKTVRYVRVSELGNDDYLEDLSVYTDSVEMVIEFKG